jgi:hypothetical protein
VATRYTIDYEETQGIDETLSAHLADPHPNWRLVRVIERKHTETFIIECYDDDEFYSITRSYDEDGEAHWKVTA